MKKLLITQYATEEIKYSRQVVVEVPDDFDEMNSLHPEKMEQFLDGQATEENVWFDGDSTGPDTDQIDVECELHVDTTAPADFAFDAEWLATEGGVK